ncbi:BA75_02207T0 [Komagataella pastoris]|uniref:BA75_02207T0 n=1 Tax=Komagataella pastoris TaxID=4922 RepID=A0A1B2JBK7_PICPA|nr:BA75_02207T0 [Komagataella pastoris]
MSRSIARSIVRTNLLTNLRRSALVTQRIPVSSLFVPSITNKNAVPVFLFRSYSKQPIITEEPPAKVYNYEQIKDLTEAPDNNVVLVDVREPDEYKAGFIPGAVNIPFKSSPGALNLSKEDFLDTFEFEKPSKDKELIFYCLGGVRSSAAEELAGTFGYLNRGNYIGSWEDWVAHENKEK